MTAVVRDLILAALLLGAVEVLGELAATVYYQRVYLPQIAGDE